MVSWQFITVIPANNCILHWLSIGFGNSQPARITESATCKTVSGKSVRVEAGEACVVLNKTTDMCTVMLPKVNEPVNIKCDYIQIY